MHLIDVRQQARADEGTEHERNDDMRSANPHQSKIPALSSGMN